MHIIIVQFQEGDRGPIAKRPDDRGAWVVPDRKVNRMYIEYGVQYIVAITGVAQSGKLRFCKVLASVEQAERMFQQVMQLAATEKDAPIFQGIGPRIAEALEHSETIILTEQEVAPFAKLKGDSLCPIREIVLELTGSRVSAMKSMLDAIKDPGKGNLGYFKLYSTANETETCAAEQDEAAIGFLIAEIERTLDSACS